MPAPVLSRVAADRLGPVPRSLAAAAITAVLAAGCLAVTASGGVIIDAEGTSAAGNPVAFRATLSFAADELFLDLENLSPVATSEPADVLASFYFDVARDEARPPLAYRSAAAQVYEVRRNAVDRAIVYQPPAVAGGTPTILQGFGPSDLVATKRGDLTWQFRALDPASQPLAGFGLGTVGNSTLSPSGFDPKIVDQSDFAIYRGADIDPLGNLAGRYLSREAVRFSFTGARGWSEADIAHRFSFGLGTSPDSLIVVSVGEPAGAGGAALLGTGVMGIVAARRGRRAAAPAPRP